MTRFETLAAIEVYLAALPPVAFVPRLASPTHMPGLMEALGSPQERYKSVHVAGTSGKTSTAYYAAVLLAAGGHRVGLTISPHAEMLNERVQIDGRPLPERLFCAEFTQFTTEVAHIGTPLNYFQLMTAFAFWEFARQQVDYAVVEVGIGGLADSTNVIAREDKICIITDISYGHTSVLGKTLPEIATHKAGIIQLHNTVFCRGQGDEILTPVQTRAHAKRADLHIVQTESDWPFLPAFQQRNFAMAAAAAQYALARDGRPSLTTTQQERAARITIPSRMEAHSLPGGKTLVLDAAHNPQKMHALMLALAQRYPGISMAVLFAPTKGPQPFYDAMLAELRPAAQVFLTSFPPDASGRFGSAPSEPLLHDLQSAGAHAASIPDAAQAFAALQQSSEQLLVVTGSFYLLNCIRPLAAQATNP